ncbi:hypothetical protein R8Z57_04955 [Microbacterium sp. M3]|uniref:Uncharacterized protein n=1 Tax=Microbacterium arthrosphaerae TaxID=792652 RepID=A0ABU4GYG8_9MICO|nr:MULTISPECIES: hypothetical protein [Microbacterium]MDW4572125.1 hypothetical protein [Microbacterium arthrosphaerae]MDW7605980.1 hypothetical protein [Microbacterium sp. M3]
MPAPLPEPSASSTPAVTADELAAQLVRLTEETIAAAPATTWKHDTEANNPDAEGWDPQRPLLSYSTTCGPDAGRFQVWLFGGPSAQPAADAERVAQSWTDRGYSVRTVVPTQSEAGGSDHTEIAADLPDGAELAFIASTEVTGIVVQTACSTADDLEEYVRAQ